VQAAKNNNKLDQVTVLEKKDEEKWKKRSDDIQKKKDKYLSASVKVTKSSLEDNSVPELASFDSDVEWKKKILKIIDGLSKKTSKDSDDNVDKKKSDE